MRRIFLVLLLMVFGVAQAEAGRTEIRLNIPKLSQGSNRQQLVYLRMITDNRTFEDRPNEASTPSIAEGGVASTTPEERRFYIARVRDGYGKARNNIFLDPKQPVEQVVRELLTACLSAQGYRVIGEPGQAGDNILIMDVVIDQLWGFIVVKGGGWAGDTPKMAGSIKTVLNVTGADGAKGRYEVSGEALHKFMLMTSGHWVKMFEELFDDYRKNLERVKLP
ncbi:MAG: YajG family lipoprotein [Proteobacteria bacterium]|nr:YajG family lipoprotein [Pseudomonadota bacterium]MBU1687515.1 YajG family lipoprotein [Pseudomonadota bacterium]